MYDFESGKSLYDSFINNLKRSIKGLNEEITICSKNKPLFEALVKYSETKDVTLLFPYQTSTLLSPEVRDSIRKLEFLQRHNITSAPQYLAAKAQIDSSEESKNASNQIKQINARVEKAKRNIIINESVIKGEEDSDQLETALKSTGLSPRDQVEILKFVIYRECKKENDRKQENSSSLQEDISVEIEKLKVEINETIEELSTFITDNYHYLEGQNKEQLRYKSEIAFAMQGDTGEIDVNEIKEPKVYFQVLLLSLLAEKANLTYAVKEAVGPDSSSEDLEVFRELKDDVRKKVELGHTLIDVITNVDKEKDAAEPSNLIILNDLEGNPVVNFDSFEGNDAKSVEYILKKLEKGHYDHAKGLKHSRVLTDDPRIKETIYINRKDGIACSYIRLTDEMVLIMACSSIKDIYDKSKRTYVENKDTIELMANLARTDINAFNEKYTTGVSSKGVK